MKRLTKKDIALSLHAAGRTVEEIARALQTTPSYVANTLIAAGKPSEYSDLYTTSTVQNSYARLFNGVLRFKDVEAAQESVARIDALYHQFAEEGDRRGQHQAQLMALIGKNRAEGIGKVSEAKVFAEWLIAHLETSAPPPPDQQALSFDADPSEADSHLMSPYDASLAFA
jgi:hypothetical protein